MTDPISSLGGSGRVLLPPALVPKKPDSKATSLEADPVSSDRIQGIPEATASVTPAASQETERERLQEAAKVVEAHLSSLSTDLEFGVDDDTRIMTLKVIDSDTKNVIREYPSEEVLKMAKFIQERLKSEDTGWLVDMQH